MAGYDTRSKTDYRAKAAQEVAKIQAKARLLEERLEAFQQGDTMKDGDVFSELAAALQSAQPKIQKMCEEESDDHEAVAKLLEINDSIHRTVERYKLMKKGDLEAAQKVASGAPLPSTSGSSKSAAQELSLIDFDGEPDTTNGSSSEQPGSQSTGIENDLLGLSIGDSTSYGQGGALTLGFGANQRYYEQHNHTSSTVFLPIRILHIPSASQSGTPQPSGMSAFKPPQQQALASNDPFAALGSPVFSSKPATPAPPPAATAPPAAVANDDDEWSFSSALPPEAPSQPKEHKTTVSDSIVKIEMIAGRTGTGNAMNLSFAFSNNSAQPITELHYQLAATKRRGVTQFVEVWHAGDKNRKVQSLKLRWRISYKVGAESKNEMGEIPEFSIA
ncbi:VHS domain-containing protein [Colletotrichum tofieldiae]|nr:VHS domain-containing protein [Colletotrichum tofieldiae]